MPVLAPLLFTPRLVAKIWGGRRLESVLGKPLPPAGSFGEAWEISAHPGDETTVAWPEELKGKTIAQLVQEFGAGLLGRFHLANSGVGGFPLLYKFIDAEEMLSVQVHPDDEYARKHENDAGKTECWVVVACRPKGLIYRGFKAGSDLALFDRLLAAGRLEECLHSFQVAPGDVVFLPAGTVHAIGKGILLAEIQQSSDLTYRVYDWNRLEAGKPRPLHVQKARQVMNFGPVGPDLQPPLLKTELPAGGRLEELVRCEKFVLERAVCCSPEPVAFEHAGSGRFSILSALSGRGRIQWKSANRDLERGQSFLIPAALEDVHISAWRPAPRPSRQAGSDLVVLNAFVPD